MVAEAVPFPTLPAPVRDRFKVKGQENTAGGLWEGPGLPRVSRALPGPHSWWLLIVHQLGSYPSRPQSLLGCWARALIGETPPPEPGRSM